MYGSRRRGVGRGGNGTRVGGSGEVHTAAGCGCKKQRHMQLQLQFYCAKYRTLVVGGGQRLTGNEPQLVKVEDALARQMHNRHIWRRGETSN